MKYTGTAQNPEIEDSGDAPPYWNYELIQHYVRDVGGNELAIYNDTTVTFWNVYGIDNAGKINYSDNSWNYYLKDHLGSPRVVIDQNGDIISAEDLDMCLPAEARRRQGDTEWLIVLFNRIQLSTSTQEKRGI